MTMWESSPILCIVFFHLLAFQLFTRFDHFFFFFLHFRKSSAFFFLVKEKVTEVFLIFFSKEGYNEQVIIISIIFFMGEYSFFQNACFYLMLASLNKLSIKGRREEKN